MKTKTQVLALMKKLNVEMDENSEGLHYDVTFWSDREFASSSAKCLVVSWYADFNKGAFWQECFNELSEGFV